MSQRVPRPVLSSRENAPHRAPRRTVTNRMNDTADIQIRPARRRDTAALVEFLRSAPPAPGTTHAADAALLANPRNRIVAVGGRQVVGACLVIRGAGRCAAIRPPRLLQWDVHLAARLFRAAAAHARKKHHARLIQSLIEPSAADSLTPALDRAGFQPLATLSYLRRAVRGTDSAAGPADREVKPLAPPVLTWQRYSRLSHRRFADTIARTYADSLDCPKLAGLRTIDEVIETHKHTGRFTPRSWRLVLDGGRTVGVAMVNDLKGRGELVYLGVVPEARGRGIGRALLARAIRDTAKRGLTRMGLAVDTHNTPAIRLYEWAGFHEIHRRLAWFVPAERLDALGA